METPCQRLYPDDSQALNRFNGLSLLIIALHAAALILFFVNPIVAGLLIALGSTLAIGIGRPLAVLIVTVAMLWINIPLADLYPLTQFTAWKDVLLVFVLLGWMLRNLILRRPLALDHPIARPVLALIATYVASCVLSPSPQQAILGLKACVFYAAWFFILPDIIQSRRDASALITAILIATVCVSVYNFWAIQQPPGMFPPTRDGRTLPGLLQVHWGPSPSYLPPGILFGLVLAPHLRTWKKLLTNLIVIIGVGGLVVTTGRAAWASFIIACLVMGIVSRRAGFVRILIVAMIVAGIVQSTFSLKVAERASSAFESHDVSAEAREAEFGTVTLPFVLSHPFGAGTGSMSAVASAKVWSGGSSVDIVLQKGFIHNGFLLVAIESGWIGLAAYIWMLVAAALSSWRAFRASHDQFVQDLCLACLGIVVFFIGMNFAAPMLTMALISFEIWIILGLISLLPALDQPDQTHEEPSALEPALSAPVMPA